MTKLPFKIKIKINFRSKKHKDHEEKKSRRKGKKEEEKEKEEKDYLDAQFPDRAKMRRGGVQLKAHGEDYTVSGGEWKLWVSCFNILLYTIENSPRLGVLRSF